MQKGTTMSDDVSNTCKVGGTIYRIASLLTLVAIVCIGIAVLFEKAFK